MWSWLHSMSNVAEEVLVFWSRSSWSVCTKALASRTSAVSHITQVEHDYARHMKQTTAADSHLSDAGI